MKDRLLRFFTLEHPVQMFIAIGLAHMALTTARRVKNERRRFAWTSSLMILAMILILTAIRGLDRLMLVRGYGSLLQHRSTS